VNLVANEGVDRPVVERLRQNGHDVVYVAELSPGITDEEVLQQANARSAVLLTADKDFGELVFRQGLVHSGVVLLRLAGLANVTKAEIVAEVCRDRAAELIGAFSVVSPGQVRIRQKA
jgi:predicted nuclease of predicted toxin-antitoxin system